MEGVLIVAHGSRSKNSNAILHDIIHLLKEELPNTIIEGAFISFSDIKVETELKKLIEQGVTEISIVPYFLFDGIHVNTTVPQYVNSFMKDYPDIKVTYCKTLGVDKRIVAVLSDRIKNY